MNRSHIRSNEPVEKLQDTMTDLRVYVLTLSIVAVAVAGPPLQVEEPVRGVFSRFDKGVRQGFDNKDQDGKAMLPASLYPKHYAVTLRPILYGDETGSDWTAPGFVDITATALTAVNNIVLHKHTELTVNASTVKVTGPNGDVQINETTWDNGQSTLTIALGANLVVGSEYHVIMNFIAPIRTSKEGLYRALYTDPVKGERRMATTQFEAYGARQAFPCFDEPQFQSNYTFRLGRNNASEGYTTITNGQLLRTEANPDIPGWVWDIYETTVPMPSYLVAIVVSDFKYATAHESLFGKPVRIYGAPEKIDRGGGELAANVSARTLRFLEETFDFKYALSKMDSVAVPGGYFAPGAMENWGLVTYKDNYLLYFENETTEATRQTLQSVIAHEFAHQWFGNLVTCKYWSNIWLNEGFATYVANLVVQQEFKEYDDETEMLWGSVQSSMTSAAGINTYPILDPQGPLDSFSSPSVVIYDKAGSMIRMMQGFLGYETLIKGLRQYLKNHAYDAAVQDNLWEALDLEAQAAGKVPAGKTIKDIMDTWTTQPGFPLVRVKKNNNGRIHLTQERFGSATGAPNTTGLWEIPVAVANADTVFANTTPDLWIEKNTLLTSYSVDTTKWLIVNPNAYGYYRVFYDDKLSSLIADQLAANRSAIGHLSRSQLIDDYFNLATNGYIGITQALEMTRGLVQEREFVVWYSLFTVMTKSLAMFRHTDPSALKAYLLPAIEGALDQVGWDQMSGEHGTRVMFRAKLVDWACSLDSEKCKNRANSLRTEWAAAPQNNPIGFDLQPTLYCAIVSSGGQDAFNFIDDLFSKADASTPAGQIQRNRLLQALTCVSERTLIEQLFNRTLDNPDSLDRKVTTILQGLAASTAGRDYVLQRIATNGTFEALLEKTGNLYAFRDTLSTLSSYVTDLTQLDKLIGFTETRVEMVAIQNQLNQYFNNIRNNAAWIVNNFGIMNAWFQAHVNSGN